MKDGARLTWSSGMVVVIFATLVVANVFGQTVGGKPVNIDFSPEMAKQFEWSLKQGDKEYLRLGQRVGRDGQEIVGVAVYGGLPFASSSLTVKGDLEVPLMIKIIGAKNRELTPSEDSLVPLYEQFNPQTGQLTSKLYTQASNVTWQFMEAGIEFTADGIVYVAKKKGATVAFTKNDVRLDGIIKKRK